MRCLAPLLQLAVAAGVAAGVATGAVALGAMPVMSPDVSPDVTPAMSPDVSHGVPHRMLRDMPATAPLLDPSRVLHGRERRLSTDSPGLPSDECPFTLWQPSPTSSLEPVSPPPHSRLIIVGMGILGRLVAHQV